MGEWSGVMVVLGSGEMVVCELVVRGMWGGGFWFGFLGRWWVWVFVGFWSNNSLYLYLRLPLWAFLVGSQPRPKLLILNSHIFLVPKP